jgi:hypothetical protein
MLYHEQGMLEKAAAEYAHAAQIEPGVDWPHFNLGLIFEETGEIYISFELPYEVYAVPPGFELKGRVRWLAPTPLDSSLKRIGCEFFTLNPDEHELITRIIRYGILRERLSDLLTDSLRAAALRVIRLDAMRVQRGSARRESIARMTAAVEMRSIGALACLAPAAWLSSARFLPDQNSRSNASLSWRMRFKPNTLPKIIDQLTSDTARRPTITICTTKLACITRLNIDRSWFMPGVAGFHPGTGAAAGSACRRRQFESLHRPAVPRRAGPVAPHNGYPISSTS